MTWEHHLILASALFVVGASVGSFLNVCLHRIPLGLSVRRPASRCPKCGNGISARDNLPILGWLLLRGRCRSCREPISARYPLVEFACGALCSAAYGIDLVVSGTDPVESGFALWMVRTAAESALSIGLFGLAIAAFDNRRCRRETVSLTFSPLPES